MKELLTVLFTFAIFVTLNAQHDDLKIVEEGRSMSKGTHNALVVFWPKASAKQIQKVWSSYGKKFKGKLKLDKKLGESFVDDAELKDMSDNTVDITAKFNEQGEAGTEVSFWFNLGVTYLSSEEEPKRYPAAEKFIRDFDLQVFAALAKQQLKDEQKKLKAMEKIMKALQKVRAKEDKLIAKQEKIIAKAEEAINESETKIDENEKEKEKQQEDIDKQKEVIDVIKAKLKAAK